jgi:hypothetical protein
MTRPCSLERACSCATILQAACSSQTTPQSLYYHCAFASSALTLRMAGSSKHTTSHGVLLNACCVCCVVQQVAPREYLEAALAATPGAGPSFEAKNQVGMCTGGGLCCSANYTQRS